MVKTSKKKNTATATTTVTEASKPAEPVPAEEPKKVEDKKKKKKVEETKKVTAEEPKKMEVEKKEENTSANNNNNKMKNVKNEQKKEDEKKKKKPVEKVEAKKRPAKKEEEKKIEEETKAEPEDKKAEEKAVSEPPKKKKKKKVKEEKKSEPTAPTTEPTEKKEEETTSAPAPAPANTETTGGLGFALFNAANNNNNEEGDDNSKLLELFGTASLKTESTDAPAPMTAEEVAAKREELEAKAREQRRAQAEERKRSLLEKDRSTVFVGNVPLGTKEKELSKLFKAYGAVESVRFRSVPLNPKGKEPLKVAFHRGAYVEGRDTMCAYVVFKTMAAAEKAAKEANNTLFKDKHLRVDAASNTPAYPPKRSVFVGNLAYDAKEEDLRAFFEECGPVEAVRIVRGKGARTGTGIAFVAFADRATVTTAVLKNGTKFMDRDIRVSPCLDTKKAKGVLERQKKEYEQAKKLKRRGVKGGNNPNAQKRGFAPVKSKKTTKPAGAANKNKKKRSH